MGFAFFTTPCLKFAERGFICMEDYFDVVTKDVELYQTVSGAETSEPVPAACVRNDSDVDSLTVWSRTPATFMNPSHKCTISECDEPFHDVHVEPRLHDASGETATCTGQQVDRALQEAHFFNSRHAGQKLPWESGIFAAIFDSGDNFLASNLNLCPMPPEPEISQPDDAHHVELPSMPSRVLKRDRVDNIFGNVIKMKHDVDHLTATAELWSKALKKWHTVLACAGYAGLVGAAVRDAVSGGKDYSDVLRDVFGNKSPRTANKRASTMLALFTWLENKGLCVWPVRSEHVAAYLNDTNASGAGSTKGKTLMEAFRFCKHVMRLPELDELIEDPMLSGRVRRLDAARDVIKQSRPLKLSEVKFIEEFMMSDMNIFDRYIAGCILFAIYSRSRWSDLAFLSDLSLDTAETELGLVGFVEGATKYQKTGSTALKRAMQMPLVAPIRGVTDKMWAVEWFSILGQVQFDTSAKPIGAICRPPTNGKLGTRHISSEEIGDFLNHMLGLHGEGVVTSHCMKATTLTWCAKYGLDEPARTLLGHHELQSQSLACYSRDMLSRPLALYESMLLNIRTGHFLPDETRSGRFIQCKPSTTLATSDAPPRVPVKVEPLASEHGWSEAQPVDRVVGVVDLTEEDLPYFNAANSEAEGDREVHSQVSSDDSSSSSSSSSAHEEPLQQKYALDGEARDCDEPVYQHKKSRVLHRPNKASGLLACGRRVGGSYNFLQHGASFKWARCSLCFKGEVTSKVDDLAEYLAAMHDRRNAQP